VVAFAREWNPSLRIKSELLHIPELRFPCNTASDLRIVIPIGSGRSRSFLVGAWVFVGRSHLRMPLVIHFAVEVKFHFSTGKTYLSLSWRCGSRCLRSPTYR
jgi:hypothetical protein